MNFIEARKLVHEYFRRDEEGNVEGITTALDGEDFPHMRQLELPWQAPECTPSGKRRHPLGRWEGYAG